MKKQNKNGAALRAEIEIFLFEQKKPLTIKLFLQKMKRRKIFSHVIERTLYTHLEGLTAEGKAIKTTSPEYHPKRKPTAIYSPFIYKN